MSLTHLPHVQRPHPDLRARRWVWGCLQRHNVREDVICAITARCRFVIDDWENFSGGGGCTHMDPPHRMIVRLNGRQDEACVHECAHVYRHILIEQGEWDAAGIVGAMQAESEAAPGDYPRIRQLCRDYRWGVGDWSGMMTASGWNDSEIWAGLASGSMGDMSLYPPRLRRLYAQFYDDLPGPMAAVVAVP